MTLEYIIISIITLAIISLITFVTYIAKKQVDFELKDDGVDELKELNSAYDNLIESMYERGIIDDKEKEELKK